ncbi:hypothetical protein Tco_0924017, partial [Tanacetum coccineum]
MCTDMIELQIDVECPKLKHLEVSYAKLRALDLGLTPNPLKLKVKNCYDLKDFYGPLE